MNSRTAVQVCDATGDEQHYQQPVTKMFQNPFKKEPLVGANGSIYKKF